MPVHSHYQSPSSPRGFTLIMTITLVVFLAPIFVGLASFTRVENQVASNAQTLFQAHPDAILALTIALVAPQLTAGPD